MLARCMIGEHAGLTEISGYLLTASQLLSSCRQRLIDHFCLVRLPASRMSKLVSSLQKCYCPLEYACHNVIHRVRKHGNRRRNDKHCTCACARRLKITSAHRSDLEARLGHSHVQGARTYLSRSCRLERAEKEKAYSMHFATSLLAPNAKVKIFNEAHRPVMKNGSVVQC